MPYTLSNKPDRIKALPKKAQDIWIKAFNSAYNQYNGNEQKSNSTAWAAIKKSGYKQVNGIWKRWE